MASRLKLALLLTGILAGCASHQVTQKHATPAPLSVFEAMQVQVNFATPAHSDYLADQLVEELGKHGIDASVLDAESRPGLPNANAGLLLSLIHI